VPTQACALQIPFEKRRGRFRRFWIITRLAQSKKIDCLINT
jgi:hypothetical protein